MAADEERIVGTVVQVSEENLFRRSATQSQSSVSRRMPGRPDLADVNDIKAIWIKNPLLHKQPERICNALSRTGTGRVVKAGSPVYRSGDDPNGCFAILGGRIRLSYTNSAGKQVIFGVLQPGDWFGELSLVDDLPRFHDAVAIGDATVFMLSRAEFQLVVDEVPSFQSFISEILGLHMRSALTMLVNGKTLPLANQIAQVLVGLFNSAASRQGADSPTVTQDELAATVGASRQTVNKILRQFQDKNIVRVSYRRIVPVDLAMLAKLAQNT